MGRPKKRKLHHEASNIVGSVDNDTSQSASERDLHSDSGQETEQNVILPEQADMVENSGDAPFWLCEADQIPEVDSVLPNLEAVPSKESCACLATLYLSLDEIRGADEICFASGLSLLRDITARAVTIIQCPTCPSRFVWAMQNAQVLNTLIMSTAEAYQRVFQSVEAEARRAESLNETKALWFGETQATDSALGVEDRAHGPLSFALSLSPSEWQQLAKKAMKSEIIGAAHSSSTPFLTMLQLLEDRQLKWHSGISPASVRCHAHNHVGDKEPMCVLLVRQAREMVTQLPFDT
ncbi:hypothetical protein G7046_g2208 [Stylonectria norvegica]|nr:hypothetical protein G7046_g2208 [Stylonectria norvegica]